MAVNRCKSCGAEIEWMRTPAGKLMPVNASDGLSHFTSCPDAQKWSKSKATKKPKPEAIPFDEPLPF